MATPKVAPAPIIVKVCDEFEFVFELLLLFDSVDSVDGGAVGAVVGGVDGCGVRFTSIDSDVNGLIVAGLVEINGTPGTAFRAVFNV